MANKKNNISVDTSFASDDDALEWLRLTGYKMLKLAFKDSRVKNLKLKRHQSTHNWNRLSALVWVWVPGEGKHPLLTFDNCCLRLNLDPDDLRLIFKERLTEDEIEQYRKYRPYLFD